MLFRVFFGFSPPPLSSPLLPLLNHFSSFFPPSGPLFFLSFPIQLFPRRLFARLSRKAGARQVARLKWSTAAARLLSRNRRNFRESSHPRRRRNSPGNNKSDYLERLFLSSARISDVSPSIWRCVSLRRDTSTHAFEWIFPPGARTVRNVKTLAVHPTFENSENMKLYKSEERSIKKQK